MAVLTKEIIAIVQPTYNDTVIKWNEFGLNEFACLPSKEEWKDEIKYMVDNFLPVIKELGLNPLLH